MSRLSPEQWRANLEAQAAALVASGEYHSVELVEDADHALGCYLRTIARKESIDEMFRSAYRTHGQYRRNGKEVEDEETTEDRQYAA